MKKQSAPALAATNAAPAPLIEYMAPSTVTEYTPAPAMTSKAVIEMAPNPEKIAPAPTVTQDAPVHQTPAHCFMAESTYDVDLDVAIMAFATGTHLENAGLGEISPKHNLKWSPKNRGSLSTSKVVGKMCVATDGDPGHQPKNWLTAFKNEE